jgi:hypothetical protein
LKTLNPRQERPFGFVAGDLDFVASGLDFRAPDLDFGASGFGFRCIPQPVPGIKLEAF